MLGIGRKLGAIAIAAASIAVLSSPQAKADPIAPGGALTTLTSGTATGTVLASVLNNPFTIVGSGAGSGTYNVLVYQDTLNPYASGDITVAFNFTIATGDVSRVTLTDFAGFQTDVVASGPGAAPLAVSRTNDGTGVGFSFIPNLNSPATSETFYIRTNATTYGTGSILFQDGGQGSGPSFAPAPLPATASMGFGLLGCLGGFGLLRRRRQLA